MKKVQDMTLEEIKNAMVEDGYGNDFDLTTYRAIQKAARAGTLLWTREHIVTVDESGLNLKPDWPSRKV